MTKQEKHSEISTAGYFRLASTPEDYSKLGISPDNIAPYEDGIRTKADQKTAFEWWYFDTHLTNGTSVVVVFYTKNMNNPEETFAPRITLEITKPDGTIYHKLLIGDPEDFDTSTEHCDVRIGENRFEGDLTRYHIAATIEDISVDIELVNEVPAWRPNTGHMYFGQDQQDEKLFAWLPSVPQGKVNIDYSIAGENFSGTGFGYHDHNWGDVPMATLMHNWYWARGKVGPYTVIASYITAVEKYNYDTQTVFMLAKDGKVIADDASKVEFVSDDVFTDEKTGKPVANMTRYIYRDQDVEYVVTFQRKQTILQHLYADDLPPAQREAAIAAGMDSAYLRFDGTVTIEARKNGELVDRYEDPALWELMYFGHARIPAT